MSENMTEVWDFIDSQLSMQSEGSVNAIIKIISDDEICNACRNHAQFIYLYLGMGIFVGEIKDVPYEKSILYDVSSIDELTRKITRYRHLIFNIDFDVCREEALETIKSDLENDRVSTYMIEYMVEKMSFDKELTGSLIKNTAV